MKRLSIAAVLTVVLASSTFAGVDPSLLSLVMPDAKVLFGVQVDQAQASPFGQYILSEFNNGADFDKLIAVTGFDPRRDLHEVLGATVDGQNGLILGRGLFLPARIGAAAVLAGATSTSYQGIEILTGPGQASESFAFLDSSTVVFGQKAAVTAAIDRKATGTRFSGDLADKAKAVSASNDAWFATLTPPGSFIPGAVAQSFNQIPLQAALQASGGVKFATTGVTVSAEVLARSSQDAQSMVDVGKFLASLVQMNRDKNPGARKIATLADAAMFNATGSVATLTVTLPEQQVEELLMPPAPAGARARRIARH